MAFLNAFTLQENSAACVSTDHDTRFDCTCQRGLPVSSRGFRRVSPVQGSTGTKIRAEALRNGDRFLRLHRSSSTFPAMSRAVPSLHGAFRYSAPFAFLRKVCYGTFFSWTYCSFGTGILALRLSLRTSTCCTSGGSYQEQQLVCSCAGPFG